MNNNIKEMETFFPEKLQLSVERFEKNQQGNTLYKSWDNTHDGMPNIFNRTSIFSSEKSKEDQIYNQKEIVSYIKNCNIKYTGPALDKRDYQVFQLCLLSAKNNKVKLGEMFRIFPSEWLSILKRTDNTRSRNELEKSMKKLTSANINMLRVYKDFNGEFKEDVSGTLLSGFKRIAFKEVDDGLIRSGKKVDVKWMVAINPCIKELFSNDLTLIDLKRSAEIKSCLGLWLYDFYSSHHNPIPISTQKLKILSGANSTLSHFNQSLEKNLKKLVEIGFLFNYHFEFKNKKEKLLIVEKCFKSPIYSYKKAKKENKLVEQSKSYLVL